MKKANLTVVGIGILLALGCNASGEAKSHATGTLATAVITFAPNPAATSEKKNRPNSGTKGTGTTEKSRKAKNPNYIKFDGIDGEIKDGRKQPGKGTSKAKSSQPGSSQTGAGATAKSRKSNIKFDGLDGEIKDGRKQPRKVKKP